MFFCAGAGESGKSTVVKQMKIIHGDGYSPKELQDMIVRRAREGERMDDKVYMYSVALSFITLLL